MGHYIIKLPKNRQEEREAIQKLPEVQKENEVRKKLQELYHEKRAAETALEFFQVVTVNRRARCAITGDVIQKGLKAIRIPNTDCGKTTTFISLHAVKKFGLLAQMKKAMKEADEAIKEIRATKTVDPQSIIKEYGEIREQEKEVRNKSQQAIEKWHAQVKKAKNKGSKS